MFTQHSKTQLTNTRIEMNGTGAPRCVHMQHSFFTLAFRILDFVHSCVGCTHYAYKSLNNLTNVVWFLLTKKFARCMHASIEIHFQCKQCFNHNGFQRKTFIFIQHSRKPVSPKIYYLLCTFNELMCVWLILSVWFLLIQAKCDKTFFGALVVCVCARTMYTHFGWSAWVFSIQNSPHSRWSRRND